MRRPLDPPLDAPICLPPTSRFAAVLRDAIAVQAAGGGEEGRFVSFAEVGAAHLADMLRAAGRGDRRARARQQRARPRPAGPLLFRPARQPDSRRAVAPFRAPRLERAPGAHGPRCRSPRNPSAPRSLAPDNTHHAS
jgi:hypothetical protein